MKTSVVLSCFCLCFAFTQPVNAESPPPSEVKNLSPDKKWEYDCPQSVEYECAPEVVNAGTNETVVDLDDDLNVYGKHSKRSNID